MEFKIATKKLHFKLKYLGQNMINMKNFFKLLFTFIIGLTYISCDIDETIIGKTTVKLTFIENKGLNQKITKRTYKEIVAEVIYDDERPKLISDKLIEIEFKNSISNKFTYGYILKSNRRKLCKSNNIFSRSIGCTPSIEEGFGFDGTCFVYGTFYNGRNCETLFVPCGLSCYTFGEVCPGPGEAFT